MALRNLTPALSTPPGRLRDLAPLLLVAWALNLYCYSGYYMSDDGSYLDAIQHLAALQPIDITNIAHTRLMVVAPAALVYAASGSLFLTILAFTLYHPLLVLVAYWMGRLAFEPRAAFLGAALVAASPSYYFYGGAVLPDNCLSLWLGVLLAALLWTLRGANDPSRSERRELGLWLAVGGLNGIAYAAKEPGLVFAVPVALTILIGGLQRGARWRAVRGVCAFGAGLLAFLVLESVVLRVLSGGWHLRLSSGMANDQNVAALIERVTWQGLWPGERLAFWYSRNSEYFGLGFWVIIAANLTAVGLGTRGGLREARAGTVAILLGFWLWPFLYLTLGTTSLQRYLPPPLQHPRYFSICVAPALLITAAVLLELFERAAQRLPEQRLRLRRLLRAVPGGLAAVWGLAMFLHFEPAAGTVYRALETKAALAAFQDARRLHPDLPVVLSTYLAARLWPVWQARGCTACDKLITQVDSLAQPPARPFVALMASRARRDSLGPALTRLQRSGKIRLQPLGLGVYRAPLGRRSELRSALYPLLGELAEPSGPLAESKEAIGLYLVSDVRVP